jgi:hypothetical protein
VAWRPCLLGVTHACGRGRERGGGESKCLLPHTTLTRLPPSKPHGWYSPNDPTNVTMNHPAPQCIAPTPPQHGRKIPDGAVSPWPKLIFHTEPPKPPNRPPKTPKLSKTKNPKWLIGTQPTPQCIVRTLGRHGERGGVDHRPLRHHLIRNPTTHQTDHQTTLPNSTEHNQDGDWRGGHPSLALLTHVGGVESVVVGRVSVFFPTQHSPDYPLPNHMVGTDPMTQPM